MQSLSRLYHNEGTCRRCGPKVPENRRQLPRHPERADAGLTHASFRSNTRLLSRLQPSLRQTTFDDVSLNPFAPWTRKCSQVLAVVARLDGRQLHRRTASRTLRTLVLGIEHVLSPQFGTLSSPSSHPETFDLRGSDAMRLISTWSHFGHSNSRWSKPIGPGETRSSIIRAWQREQRGRSIEVKNCWDGGKMLPWFGGSLTELSVTDNCRGRGGDEPYCANSIPAGDQSCSHSKICMRGA